MGCKFLLKEVWRVRPKVHIFGHVHAGYGSEYVFWDEGQKAYESVCARKKVGPITDILDICALLALFKIIWYDLKGVLWSRVWGGNSTNTLMVNAALTFRTTERLGNAPHVIHV